MAHQTSRTIRNSIGPRDRLKWGGDERKRDIMAVCEVVKDVWWTDVKRINALTIESQVPGGKTRYTRSIDRFTRGRFVRTSEVKTLFWSHARYRIDKETLQTIKTTRSLEIEHHDFAKSLTKCALEKSSVSTVYFVQVWFVFYYLFEKRLKNAHCEK